MLKKRQRLWARMYKIIVQPISSYKDRRSWRDSSYAKGQYQLKCIQPKNVTLSILNIPN